MVQLVSAPQDTNDVGREALLSLRAPDPRIGVRLALDGRLTIEGAVELKALLLQTAYENALMDVDLKAVSHLDCSALQVLLLVERVMGDRGGELRFIEPSPAVREVFELLGLETHLATLAIAEPGFGFF